MDGLDNLRVASFSAYLNPADQESFALKLAAVVQEAVPAIMSPSETPRAVSFRRPKPEKEGEIGIFGADKYFNVKMEYKSPKPVVASELMQQTYRKHDLFSKKEVVKPRMSEVGMSTVCTESSWNSQVDALLPPRDHGNSSRFIKPKKPNFFKGFGCRGPCRGSREESKKMVSDSSTKNPKSGLKSQDQFAFPILNVKNDIHNPDPSKKICDELPRNSIEVFGSQKVKKGDEMNQMIAKNLERKLSMLTWDAIPKKPHHNNFPTVKPSVGPVEEALSDASSDLFEIETLSGVGLPYLSVPPTADDNASGCMTPTTLYEPSEASIEWSVVTASAVNDFSFVSDFDDRSMAGDLNLIPGSKNLMGKEGHKNKGSSTGFLGCKSQKAVSVVQNNIV